jgi:hypothetical protein
LILIKAGHRARALLLYNSPSLRGRFMSQQIPGTTIFNGVEAQKGLPFNKMCFSFNSAENRAEFLRDQDAYCAKFGLTLSRPRR